MSILNDKIYEEKKSQKEGDMKDLSSKIESYARELTSTIEMMKDAISKYNIPENGKSSEDTPPSLFELCFRQAGLRRSVSQIVLGEMFILSNIVWIKLGFANNQLTGERLVLAKALLRKEKVKKTLSIEGSKDIYNYIPINEDVSSCEDIAEMFRSEDIEHVPNSSCFLFNAEITVEEMFCYVRNI